MKNFLILSFYEYKYNMIVNLDIFVKHWFSPLSHVDTIHVVHHDTGLDHGFSKSSYPSFFIAIIFSHEVKCSILH